MLSPSYIRRSHLNRSSRRRSSWSKFWAVCCFGFLGFWAEKAVGAEEIILSYGAFEFPVSVESLETYAETGNLDRQLKNYADFFTSEQLQQFRTGLTTSADFDHLAIAQFLYSFQGEKLLERVSRVIRTKARQPGFYAIRSALILAAADKESGGLTPLNVLKKFPTAALRIDSRRGFKIVRDLSQVVQKNNQAIAAVEQQANLERQNIAADVPKVRNLNLLTPGKYRYRQQVLTMNDRSRGRTFPVELYLPQLKDERTLPLIVISHGLGSDLNTFAYLARHLASHGFAVAVPEHPGSSAKQIDALLSGLASDVTPPEELIDRPLDIKFLLDRLAARYGNQIDTDNVGAIGQSFGAYTTLALAGAELNWDSLERDCPDINDSWNLSLLIQCLALQIPPTATDIELKDERITAAIAINPLASTVFAKESLSQIDIPIMLVSGSADPVTPALPEQIVPFTWLTAAEKYLVLLEGGTHFSVLNESAGSVPIPEQAIGPDPKLAQDYIKQLGLAFFGLYVTQQPIYADYLNAEYGAVISKREIPLDLIEALSPESLRLF
ncbi:alpha/beta hydrolase [Pleurocapsales cyanobacterium LEGE 10410]|nr:alpha/beta hydrolase [Pleurocapsales cyanobacterium LEGE 10410]